MQSIEIPAPRGVHPDTLSDPACSIQSADAAFVVTYCRRNRVGAVFFVAQQMWALYVPMALPEFAGTLIDRGIRLPASRDVSRWLEACGAQQIDAALARGLSDGTVAMFPGPGGKAN